MTVDAICAIYCINIQLFLNWQFQKLFFNSHKNSQNNNTKEDVREELKTGNGLKMTLWTCEPCRQHVTWYT